MTGMFSIVLSVECGFLNARNNFPTDRVWGNGPGGHGDLLFRKSVTIVYTATTFKCMFDPFYCFFMPTINS